MQQTAVAPLNLFVVLWRPGGAEPFALFVVYAQFCFMLLLLFMNDAHLRSPAFLFYLWRGCPQLLSMWTRMIQSMNNMIFIYFIMGVAPLLCFVLFCSLIHLLYLA